MRKSVRKAFTILFIFSAIVGFSQSIHNAAQIGQTGRNQCTSTGFWVKSDTALFTAKLWIPNGAGAGLVFTSDANGFGTWQAGGGGLWATSGNDIYNTNSGNILIGANSISALTVNSTGSLLWYSNDPYFGLDGNARRFQLGDYTYDWYGTYIDVNDDVAQQYINLHAHNGVTVSNLAGGGSKVVTVDNNGLLGDTSMNSLGWSLTGNASTPANFVGTTNSSNLYLKSGFDYNRYISIGDSALTPDGANYTDGTVIKDNQGGLVGIVNASPFGGSSSTVFIGNINNCFSVIDSTGFNFNTPSSTKFTFDATGFYCGSFKISPTSGSINQVLTLNGSNEASWQNVGGGGGSDTSSWKLGGNTTPSSHTFGLLSGADTLQFIVNNVNAGNIISTLQTTSFGFHAMDSAVFYGAFGNTALGQYAFQNGRGNLNTAIGRAALTYNTSGTANVGIGESAGANAYTGSYNTCIGGQSDVSGDGSYVLQLGAGFGHSNQISFSTNYDSLFLDLGTASAPCVGCVLTNVDGVGSASWQTPTGGSGWSLTGNAGTAPATNFIGTSDGSIFTIERTNPYLSGLIQITPSLGKVYIGDVDGYINATNIILNDFYSNITVSSSLGVTIQTDTTRLYSAVKIVDGTQGAGKVLTSDASGLASWQAVPTIPTIQQGVYLPDSTGGINCSLLTRDSLSWFRVGDMVSVSGYVKIKATSPAIVNAAISIPVASNLDNIKYVGGSLVSGNLAVPKPANFYIISANQIGITYTATTTNNDTWMFILNYRVR